MSTVKRVTKKGGGFDDNNDDIGGGRGDKMAQEDVGRRERRVVLLRFGADERGRRRLVERFREIARLLARSSRYTHFIGIHHGKDTQGRH